MSGEVEDPPVRDRLGVRPSWVTRPRPTAPAGSGRRPPADLAADLRRGLTRHAVLVVLLLLGLALRIASDAGLDITAVVGLVSTVAAYVVCVRWGCWRWLGAVAALPAAVDARMLLAQGTRPTYALLLLSAGLVIGSWRGRSAPLTVRVLAVVLMVTGAVLAIAADVVSDPTGVATVRFGTIPWALLAVVLAGGALLGLGRAAPTDLRIVAGVCLLVGATGPLNAIAWWPVAGALGLTALLRGRRGRVATLPQQDAVDAAARADFGQRHGVPALGPVVIVIAAYNEADGIPAVLATLPSEVCGLRADVLVVDDGSTDGTAAALDETPVYVVSCPVNRGQGAALRLGYRVARDHGARYLITTDGDGQYAVSDMPAVLAPLLEDRADFVSGSRILGHQQSRDRVRRAGVHVFAWLATLLTGQRFTDTSFGLRAMRVEASAAATLNQPQYQASELLLGVVSHGFRALEVPATMNLRSAGSTKKGRNLVYGRHYARAMVGTWLREGLPRPVAETAPALRHTPGHGD